MNERQHIALTEAQIIAAEKGELQLETRDGRKVVQFVWFREPLRQTDNSVLAAVLSDGMVKAYYIDGMFINKQASKFDLFVSEPDVDFSEPTEQVSPKPLYEVGEIIEVLADSIWFDAEYIGEKNNYIAVWNGGIDSFGSGRCRKKQKPRIYISGRITGLDYNEAFAKFEAAENELIAKGYEVINPMKVVPFNKDWSWFDYLSADIKLMEKCTHIYMLSNWRESGGASVEHEAAKWNNFSIIYQ